MTKHAEALRAANARRWAKPDARREYANAVRGFTVPPEKEESYRHLTKVKRIPAKEAARILGIIV